MGKPISFKFLTKAKQREVSLLQTSSIYKQINILKIKQNQILHLQEEISYLWIEEQLRNPSIQRKNLDLDQVIRKKICFDLLNVFWERKKRIISLPYEKNFDEQNIPTRLDPHKWILNFLSIAKMKFKLFLTRSSYDLRNLHGAVRHFMSTMLWKRKEELLD